MLLYFYRHTPTDEVHRVKPHSDFVTNLAEHFSLLIVLVFITRSNKSTIWKLVRTSHESLSSVQRRGVNTFLLGQSLQLLKGSFHCIPTGWVAILKILCKKNKNNKSVTTTTSPLTGRRLPQLLSCYHAGVHVSSRAPNLLQWRHGKTVLGPPCPL